MSIPKEIKEQCLKLAAAGATSKEIHEQYYSRFCQSSLSAFQRNLRRWKNKEPQEEVKKEKKFDIIETLKKGIYVSELADELSISIQECENVVADLKNKGHNILRLGNEIKISNISIPEKNIVSCDWNGDRIIRFGLISDTHFNSKYTQITHLHTYYDICQREGIERVYHVGDIDEGEQMRPGHQYECYEQGADDHIEHICKVYPERPGIITEFITGNHDASIIKRCGYDIGRPIANKRSDMVYLGQSYALINLTPKCKMELRHPLDGAASYALSYKLQKMIDSISGGEKPNILTVGHYHKAEYILYRNIHAIQAAAFQSQTNWMKGKGISVSLGGWIIEVHVEDDGSINRITPTFIPFYKTIHDDYKNWI